MIKTPLEQDITIPSKSRKVDDSHKYPLRTSGAAGFHATAPPFLSTKNSAEVERGETNGHSSKLKGYEGHLSALEKLGSGSPTSRLFPKPGKKLMKAVGQAIQVRGDTVYKISSRSFAVGNVSRMASIHLRPPRDC